MDTIIETPSSVNEKWLSDKETKAQHTVKRGRKWSHVDEAKRTQAAIELHEAYRKIKSWDGVGRYYGISKAAAYRIANDKAYRPSPYVLDTVIEKSVSQASPKHPRSRRRYFRPCLSLELRDELERRGADPETLLWLALAVGVEETQVVTTTGSSVDPMPRTGTDVVVGTPALVIEGTSALTVAVMVGVP